MKVIFYLVATAVIVGSCADSVNVEDNRNKETVSTLAAGGQSEKELEKELAEIRKEEERKLAEELATQADLEFDRVFHDFGNVKAEKNVTTTFTVKNTGNNPLIIEDVSASCGCTTPVKPTKPIPPGESDIIEVGFKSKPGQLNEQNKTVTVTANTAKKVYKLDIRAFVVE